MEYRQNSPESASIQPTNERLNPLQHSGESPSNNYERFRPGQVERQSAQRAELIQQAGIVQPTALPQPVMTNDSATASSIAPVVGTSIPLVAADVDLIEKEWVDQAKAVIAETRDDPYKRELEVKKLQVEYVKRRYGRIIGETRPVDGES